MKNSVALFLFACSGLLSSPAPAADTLPKVAAAASDAAIRTLTWADLIPFDYRPDKIIESYMKKGEKLRDSDLEAKELMDELRRELEAAPAVPSLNNTTVKLSGYVVALESDGSSISEFLLVPYYGACIHVPPPPSNQIVLVRTKKPYRMRKMFEVVAVTGRLTTHIARHKLAWANYVMEASTIEPHKQ